nr:MAG TPA: hypothetical protein [Caudoviricetes sp.]
MYVHGLDDCRGCRHRVVRPFPDELEEYRVTSVLMSDRHIQIM